MDSSFNQESGIKIYHELMANKVGDILLVSSPYDAFIMEEEGRLSNRIIHEYKGLNLSRPPRLTWVSSADDAFGRLGKKKFRPDPGHAQPGRHGRPDVRRKSQAAVCGPAVFHASAQHLRHQPVPLLRKQDRH